MLDKTKASNNSCTTVPYFNRMSIVARRNIRVVLIDDEPAQNFLWGSILRSAGYSVTCCQDAASGLTAVGKGCDCVITEPTFRCLTPMASRLSGEQEAALPYASCLPGLSQPRSTGKRWQPAPIM
jgi:hypothetical protein